jgi:general secretion pathway protein C
LANPVRRALLAVEKRARSLLSRPEAWQRVAVAAVNAVLVIALARSLAVLSLAVVSGRSPQVVGAPAPAAPGSAANKSAGAQPSVDYATIAGWHLFGQVDARRPVEAPPVSMPTTPLNLRLAGVFFIGRGGERALALIAEGGGLERGYRIGEPLPGEARLERIQPDHVVVSRNGRQEMLKLPKADDANAKAAPPVLAPSLMPAPAPAPAPAPSPPEPESDPASFVNPQIIDASAVAGRLRNEATSRPQALEDIAFATPYLQNGQFTGFRLRPGRDRQLFQQLGLNGGDVLTEINGTRLSSPAQGLAMLQELLSANRIAVRVLRNGVEIPITFSLDGPSPNEPD